MTPNIYGHPLNTPNSKLLRVKIIQAKDLGRDLLGSNSYLVQVLLTCVNRQSMVIECLKTHSTKKKLNYQLNADFVFNIIPNEHQLTFNVMNDTNQNNNDCIGSTTIPLNGSVIKIVDENEPNAFIKIDLPLERKSLFHRKKGRLTIMMHYVSSIQVLESILNQENTSRVNLSNTRATSLSLTSINTSDRISSIPRNRSTSTDVVNNTNNNTSSPTANIINVPLPPGWEQRIDQNGRVIFIDHINKKISWIRPLTNLQNTNILNVQQANVQTPSQTEATTSSTNRYLVSENISDTQVSGQSSNSEGSSENNEQQSEEETSQASGGIRPEADQPPLPPGWDFKIADSGRMFFIDHLTKKTTWIDPRTGKPSPIPEFLTRLGSLPKGWEERKHSDGRIFYIDHNNKKTQWEDPRLEKFAGPVVPYSRDFKIKFEVFRRSLPIPIARIQGNLQKHLIPVRRSDIFEDSFRRIFYEKHVDLLRHPLWIQFDGEKSYDYGGVSREWFHLLSKEIFSPYYGLFEYSAIDNYTLQVNPNSGLVNENHLEYFHFIGRVIGMAAYHNRLIDGFFIRPFYKMILNKPIVLQDIEAVDIEYYKSMKFIMDTDDVEALDLTFTSESDVYGQKVEHELKPDGKNIKVTNENKKEFIDLVIQWRFVNRMEKQMNSLIKGFTEIVPRQCIQIFDPKEFELLLSGLGDVNIKDWQMNTLYKGEYNPHHRVITWFWMAMYSFPNELRLRFLQFVTGTSRVPMNGFAELQGSNGYQKFTIQSWGDYKQLPRAHTCFNRLDLPQYRSYEELREKLLLAIENSEGFDGVD